jgi:hypothetical protein
MSKTKEEWAALLNGREYGNEITNDEAAQAKADGIVVLFGASDDLCEMEGAFCDEAGCYDGGTLHISKAGRFVGSKGNRIEAIWCGDSGWNWNYETSIPHATFEVMEGKDKYCRGIVFHIDDLK